MLYLDNCKFKKECLAYFVYIGYLQTNTEKGGIQWYFDLLEDEDKICKVHTQSQSKHSSLYIRSKRQIK
jgi:hypothetical protein